MRDAVRPSIMSPKREGLVPKSRRFQKGVPNMKKLINDVSTVVPDMLDGLAALNPGLSLLQGTTIIVRADAEAVAARGEIALISGGGSGHEPAHGGYVGPGMLSAAVAGEVFTSPSTDAVLDAIRAVAGPAGVLLIVKNYTGDRFNFGLAAEIARAEGIAVEMVIVADDVALSAHGEHAGRRGLAGTVFLHKIAGAAAAEGRPLSEVAQIARDTAASLGTMGVALTPCTVPAAGKPGFELADDEIEWGLGIHGEHAVERAEHCCGIGAAHPSRASGSSRASMVGNVPERARDGRHFPHVIARGRSTARMARRRRADHRMARIERAGRRGTSQAGACCASHR